MCEAIGLVVVQGIEDFDRVVCAQGVFRITAGSLRLLAHGGKSYQRILSRRAL